MLDGVRECGDIENPPAGTDRKEVGELRRGELRVRNSDAVLAMGSTIYHDANTTCFSIYLP